MTPSERLHQVAPRIDENAGMVGRDRRRSALDSPRNPRSGTVGHDCRHLRRPVLYSIEHVHRRRIRTTRRIETRPLEHCGQTLGKPRAGHHAIDRTARFGSVKALAALRPRWRGATGLDGALGLAGHRPLRDGRPSSGLHARRARTTRGPDGRAGIWNSSRPPSCRKSGESRRATCHGSRWGRQTDGSPDPARSDMWAATTSP